MMLTPNTTRVDPTRTGLLRRQFENELVRRMKSILAAVRDLLITERALGYVHNITINAKFSSTQVEPEGKIAQYLIDKQLEFIQSKIAYEDIEKLEEEPHVTIRYGLHTQSPTEIKKIVDSWGAITCYLGSLNLFETPETDVLKIDVTSQDFAELNDRLAKLEHTDTHPVYVPHMTVAYLKKGTGWKYVGRSGLEGKRLRFDKLVFSDKERNKQKLSLNTAATIEPNDQAERIKDKLNAGDFLPKRKIVMLERALFITQLFPVANTRWSMQPDPDKIEAFRKWLSNQVRIKLVSGGEHEWWDKYIIGAHRRGVQRAYGDIQPQRFTDASVYRGSRGQFLSTVEVLPTVRERVRLLASRAYTDLEGVSRSLSNRIVRTLIDGLVTGAELEAIVRQISEGLDVDIRRARGIVSDTIVRMHAEGQLDAMEALGVTKVRRAAEWTIRKGACKQCRALEHIVLTPQEARGLIPRHVSCKCSWVSVEIKHISDGKKRTRQAITAAIRKSLGKKKDDWIPPILERGVHNAKDIHGHGSAKHIHSLVASAPEEYRYGSKVFLKFLTDRGIDPSQLWELHKAGHISLSRADLVERMDPNMVEGSLYTSPNGGEFHLIRDPGATSWK